VSLAYLYVNDFKTINDTQSDQRGDEIPRVVNAAIKKVSRTLALPALFITTARAPILRRVVAAGVGVQREPA
jgi:GGDEF domain-containing protein